MSQEEPQDLYSRILKLIKGKKDSEDRKSKRPVSIFQTDNRDGDRDGDPDEDPTICDCPSVSANPNPSPPDSDFDRWDTILYAAQTNELEIPKLYAEFDRQFDIITEAVDNLRAIGSSIFRAYKANVAAYNAYQDKVCDLRNLFNQVKAICESIKSIQDRMLAIQQQANAIFQQINNSFPELGEVNARNWESKLTPGVIRRYRNTGLRQLFITLDELEQSFNDLKKELKDTQKQYNHVMIQARILRGEINKLGEPPTLGDIQSQVAAMNDLRDEINGYIDQVNTLSDQLVADINDVINGINALYLALPANGATQIREEVVADKSQIPCADGTFKSCPGLDDVPTGKTFPSRPALMSNITAPPGYNPMSPFTFTIENQLSPECAPPQGNPCAGIFSPK